MKKKFSFNYETIPPGYYHDCATKKCSPRRFWHQVKFKMVINCLSSKGSLLDLGCGPGTFLSLVRESFPTLQLIGADISRGQLEYASKNTLKDANVQLIHLQTPTLPLPDHSLDFITLIEVIEHLSQDELFQIFSEVRRLLKPSGKLIITTPNYFSHWPILESLVNIFSEVTYSNQHVSKFSMFNITNFLAKLRFKTQNITPFFFISPFFTILSWKFASTLFLIEQRTSLPGAILLVVAQPANNENSE